MPDKPVKQPGPDHPITVTQESAHITVTAGGKTIADTKNALRLQEANYKPVYYIPRQDADMSLLSKTDHGSHCPYKGDANYYSIANAEHGTNAVWSYENPHAAVAGIKDHLAFYPDRVEISIT